MDRQPFGWSSGFGQEDPPPDHQRWNSCSNRSDLKRRNSLNPPSNPQRPGTFSCLQSPDYLRNSDPFSVRGNQDSSPVFDDAGHSVLLLRLHASRGDSAQCHSLLGLRNEHKGHGMLDNFSLLS